MFFACCHRDGIPILLLCLLSLLLCLLSLTPPAVACDQCCQFQTLICPAAANTAHGDDADPTIVPLFGTPRRGWPQDNLGDPVYLTYSYKNMFDGGLRDAQGTPVPRSQIRTAVEEAFSVWAEVAPLHFTEVPDDGLDYGQSTEYGTIRLRHRYINGPDPPTGNPTTKAVARYPGSSLYSGDIDFDNSDPWQLVGTTREPDILGAAIHEIGHTLGLTHSTLPAANMYWIFTRFTGPGSGKLHPDDIAAIQTVYGAGVGSVTPLVVPEPSGIALLSLLTGAVIGVWCFSHKHKLR